MLKKVGNFLVAGNANQSAWLLAASALSQPLSALALKVPGIGTVLTIIDSNLSKISPKAANAITPVLPSAIVAAILEVAGAKLGKPQLRRAGQMLMITNVVSIGASIGEVISSVTGLQGVDFTRTGVNGVDFTLGRRRAMHGVDFTRTGVGAIPGMNRSLRAIPGVSAMHGLTAQDRADFGRSSADFGGNDAIRSSAGTYKTPADFGAVPRISAMKGYAHTGDVQIPEDDGDKYPEEASDHMV